MCAKGVTGFMLNRLKPHILPLLVLLVATFVVYREAFGHEFLLTWDDREYVTDNPAVRGFTWAHLKAAFSTYYIGNYAPLYIISYMADYTIWGLRPSGFIFTNILTQRPGYAVSRRRWWHRHFRAETQGRAWYRIGLRPS